MKKDILDVLKYFSFFEYPPTLVEIFTYIPTRISRKELSNNLNQLIKDKILVKNKANRYTRGEYIKYIKEYQVREKVSRNKEKRVGKYLRILAFFPQIKFAGFSGSLAMNNAKPDDDIDLFIISSKKRLWTARFISLILASLFGKRRKFKDAHTNNKICLNLFFDEENLKVLEKKQTEYVAHEILQVKKVFDKNTTYIRLLESNSWIYKFFPNSADTRHSRPDRESLPAGQAGADPRFHEDDSAVDSGQARMTILGNLVENFLKKLQLYLINRHKTSEIITETQLWFFPDDFEKYLTS